jgi:N-hydroxyarylamine O-acetyltransferase
VYGGHPGSRVVVVLDDTVTGYLRRLGMGYPGPPSPEALAEIARAHVERIAYNTVDIQLGRPAPIDPAEAASRIVATGRGGYCFHLNGALSYLLTRLGYDVSQHRGGVWRDPDCDPLHPYANHLVLVVHGLPTADSPDGDWFVDAGLGDALHEPLPLVVGEYEQGPCRYQLSASPALDGGWRFQHDPTGSFTGMDFESAVAAPDAFEHSHAELSTSPTSNFVRFLAAQRRDGSGVDKLVSATLRRVEGARTVEWELRNQAEWFAALSDVFGLTLDDLSRDDRDELWRRARTAQEEWNARDRRG